MWSQVARIEGAAQALTVDGERYLVVDDRGIVEITSGTAKVLSPTLTSDGWPNGATRQELPTQKRLNPRKPGVQPFVMS